MATQKRARKNSPVELVKTMQSVQAVIEPPLTLNEPERTHFDRIVSSREVTSWSDYDLSLACQLSQAIERLSDIDKHIKNDGLMIEKHNGSMVSHPLLNASVSVSGTIQSLSRTLGLSASQRGLAGGDQDKRNLADRNAKDTVNKAKGSKLLA